MNFVRVIRFLFGYVEFFAFGGFPERFVNLCSAADIPLWDMRAKDGGLMLKTTAAGYKKIRPCAKKSGMHPHILQKKGLPFFLHKYRRRAGLLCGTVFFFAALMLLSSMLWSINISGNTRVADDEIMAVLGKCGVKHGAFIDGIDTMAARLTALSELPEISWISVNLVGSTAQVEIRERTPAPSIAEPGAPCDVVAQREGQLVKLEAYVGTGVKEVGTAVLKGDVLVSGIVENKDGSVRFRHAEGYAVVRCEEEMTLTAESKIEVMRKIRGATGARATLFGVSFPVFPLFAGKETTQSFAHEERAVINGVSLPFSVKITTADTYEKKQRTLTKNEHSLLAAEYFFEEETEKLLHCKVLEKQLTAEPTENGTAISGKVCYEKSVGVARMIDVE